MTRQTRSTLSLALCVLMLSTGCQPTQPFFFSKDKDLSHYVNVATEIEYPDVSEPSLGEVQFAQSPITITNAENFSMWDLSLQEITRLTLENSKVVRELGGRVVDGGANIATSTPDLLTQNAGGAVTSYDPALVETGNGTGTGNPNSGTGVEAALSEFDAQLDSSINWQNNDRPQNFGLTAPGVNNFFAPLFRQDTGNFTMGVTKTTADGSTFEIRNNTLYDFNNNGSRIQPSDWFTNFEAAFTHPLLQGRGTQYNRIAGPISFQQAAGGVANQIDGVLISRIRHDIALTDFEASLRNLMRDVEEAYWELYFAYRDLESRKAGRDSALETWKRIKTNQRVGNQGGEADREAQARSQYYQFESQVKSALNSLFRVENRLRYAMGLTHTDGRLIRPSDEPTIAQTQFDWPTIHSEALLRRTEVRKQKWQVKRRELELIASRNHVLPRLDAVGRYRWLGAGDQLINSSGTGIDAFGDGSNAFEVLTDGRFQEWDIGLQLSIPIGFRRALTGVRHHQLLLARERAVLQDLELVVSHQLADAQRDVDLNFELVQTFFNNRVAASDEVAAVEAIYGSGRVPLDQLLDAQRRRSEAESSFYRSLVDYNRAIMKVHFRKGSLLEFNGVFLAEGPWPGKASFDALRRARQRDASRHMNYGFTRPNVISRGPMDQSGSGQSGSGQLGSGFEEFISPQPTPAVDGPVLDGTLEETIEPPLPDLNLSTEAGLDSTAGGVFEPAELSLIPVAYNTPLSNEIVFPASLPVANSPWIPPAISESVSLPTVDSSPAAREPEPQETLLLEETSSNLPAYDPQANHSTAEAAADIASWQRTER